MCPELIAHAMVSSFFFLFSWTVTDMSFIFIDKAHVLDGGHGVTSISHACKIRVSSNLDFKGKVCGDHPYVEDNVNETHEASGVARASSLLQ